MSRPSRPPGDALARRRRVGRERRLRPEGNVTSGLGRPEAGSGEAAKAGAPVRDPTAPYYGGAAPSGAMVRDLGTPGVPSHGGPKGRCNRRNRGAAEKCGRPWDLKDAARDARKLAQKKIES